MVLQDQRGSIIPDSPLPMDNKVSVDLGTLAVSDVELNEQSIAGDDFAPKVRKPYTITKQRERWTQEEHKKFLEALKLYGRAWRRIEEHVGTKTAVQIRSHAQKFFSKVVRESNTNEGTSAKPIEIPPPRPKRKPMHPYPRKLVSPVKTGILIPEKPASPNMLGQENRSPTSVLSAVGSDSSGGPDSCMPNGSPSSASSALALNTSNIFSLDEPKLVSDQDGMSSRPDHEDENSSTDEEIPMVVPTLTKQDMDTLSENTAFVKGDTNKSAKQSLKLFGKTFLVMDPCEQSCSTQGTCGPESVDKDCSFPLRVVPLKFPMSCSEDVQNAFSDRLPMLVYTNPENKSEIACSQAPFLWLTLRSNALDSTPEVLSPTPIKVQYMYAKNEMLDNDEHKEGSCTGSNTDLVGGKNRDIDSSPRLSLERKGKVKELFSSYKLSKRISANSLNCRRGFVPYKRCFTEQDSTISSTDTGKERETQRIRFCL